MDYKQEAKKLIAQMTLEEKAGLCSGKDFWHTKAVERLNIPAIMMSDGPHGLRKQDDKQDSFGIYDSIKAVCFPSASATACSFDRDLLYELGEALGEECQAEDLAILLGPGVNMKRSPLCGRNFEYFSEDPYLAKQMGISYTKGVQSKDVGVSLKHFAANNQEYRRLVTSAEIDERTLREIYLSAFEGIVKEAKPWTIMCSYNKINGTYSSENDKLLNKILRDEWGYEGLVMSDWGAVNDRVKGVPAGLDLEMPGSGGNNDREIIRAVNEGRLDEAAVDVAVERVLELVLRAVSGKKKNATYNKPAHDAIARKIARESMVLLKNDGVLPLDKSEKIAFIGEFAKMPRFQGGGSSHVNAFKVTSAMDCVSAMKNIVFAQGYNTEDETQNDVLLKEALEAAKQSNCAVIFAGLPESYESEGYDRKHMAMPEFQNKLISEIAKVQKNTVVVLHNGSSIEIPWADDVNAILEVYLGGQAVGAATVDVLFGDYNPCGKLAETFPVKLEDNPSYLSFPGSRDQVEYREGLFIGYRYYDKKKMDVRFPFGHGLSYTTFEYSDLKISSDEIIEDNPIYVNVTVKNTGTRTGKEIVQLYIHDETSGLIRHEKKVPGFGRVVMRPEKELKGFHKIELKPGEEKEVTFELDFRSFAYYDTALRKWRVLNGTYEILIGKSSRDIVLKTTVNRKAEPTNYTKIHENSLFSDVYEIPGGREIVKEKFMRFLTSERADDHMLSLYQQPLRIARSFTDGRFTNDMMREIIKQANELLEKNGLALHSI